MRPFAWKTLIALAIIGGASLFAANAVMGNLNQDEGWYLLAALNVADGKLPYRDFMFTQGPGLPFVYALLSPLWSKLGVLGGRIFTAMLGCASCALTALLAMRLTCAGNGDSRKSARQARAEGEGRAQLPSSATQPADPMRQGGRAVPDGSLARKVAAFTALCFVALSPAHSYFTAIPKTYSLASIFIMGGMLCLTARRFTHLHSAAAGALLALAAATRISMGAALAAVGFTLLFNCRKDRYRNRWASFGIAGAAVLLASCGPFAMLWPEDFAFAQNYHATRAFQGIGAWLSLRAGFLSRTFQAYPLLWTTACALAVTRCFGAKIEARANRDGDGLNDNVPLYAVLVSFLALSAVHAMSPFPYDDYQTPVMPLLAAATAALLWSAIANASGGVYARRPAGATTPPSRESAAAKDSRPPTDCGAGREPDFARAAFRRGPLIIFAAACVLALSSPILMDWVTIRKDRFWFEKKEKPDVLVLRDVGRLLREMDAAKARPSSALLTQDAYLAVEAGMRVPEGMEMGPFCIFPHIPDEEALARHVHTPATLKRLIMEAPGNNVTLGATSGYSFAIDCPSTEKLDDSVAGSLLHEMHRAFERVKTVDNFGQSHTRLSLFDEKKDSRN